MSLVANLIDDSGSPAQRYYENAIRTLARNLELPPAQRALIDACERFFDLTEKTTWGVQLTPEVTAELDRCIEIIQSNWHLWNEKTPPPRRITLR